MIQWRWLIFFIILSIVYGCDQKASHQSYQTQLIAFGTAIELTLWDVPPQKAKQLSNDIEQQLNYMNQAWHAWHPSTLTAIEQACQNGTPLPIDPTMEALIQQGQRFYQHSQGLFNPASGHLIALWGFLSDTPTQERSPPNHIAIQAQLDTLATMDDLQIIDGHIICHHPQLRLDFGGFAKGYAIEQLMAYLQTHGVEHALINAGGDLKAIGQPEGNAWRIGLEHPLSHQPLVTLNHSDNNAIVTSGTYERFFTYDDTNYHHIINPRTGYPATETLLVTVIHPDATIADAAATSLLIASPNDWPAIAQAFGVEALLRLDNEGHLQMTPVMANQADIISLDYPVEIIYLNN